MAFPTLSSFTPNLSCAIVSQIDKVPRPGRLALHFGLLDGFRLAVVISDRVGVILSYRLRHLNVSFVLHLGLLSLFSELALLHGHLTGSKHIHIPEL